LKNGRNVFFLSLFLKLTHLSDEIHMNSTTTLYKYLKDNVLETPHNR